jgi:hypothetical protein
MSPNCKFVQVIQARTPDAPVVKKEPAWLDHVDRHPKAGSKPQ